MPTDVQFDTLADTLLANAPALLQEWCSGGIVKGHEYMTATVHGGEGDSFRFNLDKGLWKDFQTGEAGGDLVSLYACIHGMSQTDAYAALGGESEPKIKKEDLDIGPPPDDAPAVPIGNDHSELYTYTDKKGNPIAFILRYDREDGSKDFFPWSWSRAQEKWVKKAWPKNRPLYGLHELYEFPDKPVLIVEGEKTRDAAKHLMGHVYVVVTWQGGSQAIKRTNWRPLKDRDCVIWPDQDLKVAKKEGQCGVPLGHVLPYIEQPGVKAADNIVAELIRVKAASVKSVVVEGASETDGWDLADAKAEGWDWDRLYAWARPRVHEVDMAPPTLLSDEKQEKKFASQYEIWEHLKLRVSDRGQVIKNLLNAATALENWEPLEDTIWFDEFHDKIFTTWNGKRREWSDADTLSMTRYMQETMALPFSDDMVHKAIRLHAHDNTRNEPLDWLKTLEWDGIERNDLMFADAFGAKSEVYQHAISYNFMMSLVARIVRPGCKVDNMVVFEGPQGTFKSTALSIIGGDWYTEMSESVNSKDFFLALHGKLLVEIAELDSFSKAETERIKQTVTNQVDRYRKPYDRDTQDHPRRSIFVGSTNQDQYLRDSTGGRRFWPLKCGKIKVEILKKNRDQYFAEAYAMFLKGGSRAEWHHVPERETKHEQEARRQADSWEDLISEWLSSLLPVRRDDVKPIEILSECLKIEPARQDTRASMRVGRAMRKLGYKAVVKYDTDNKKTQRYYVPIVEPEDD